MKHVITNAKIKFCLLPTVYCLLFFTSCKDPDIGLIPDEQIGTHFTDTFTIKSSIILLDSIQTQNTSYLLTGSYFDLIKFGYVRAESYTQVRLSQTPVEFGPNPVLDKIVLYLDYAYYYGDTNQFQTIFIYQLENDLIDTTAYYNSDIAVYGKKLGSKWFLPKYSSDSLTITLDNQFGNDLLALDSATLGSQETFLDYFKGIAIVAPNVGNTAIFGFNAKGKSAIKLYYSNDTAASLVYEFEINAQCARFNHIESNRTGTPIGSLITTGDEISSDLTNNECYLQAGIGIRTKIEFPYLDIFKDSVGDVAINKAELVLDVVDGSIGNFEQPFVLFLFEADSNNQIIKSENGVNKIIYPDISCISIIPEAICYDEDQQTYTADLSSYIQAFLYNKIYSDEIIISPSSIKLTVNRLLFGSNKHPANPMKLKVYYTVIK